MMIKKMIEPGTNCIVVGEFSQKELDFLKKEYYDVYTPNILFNISKLPEETRIDLVGRTQRIFSNTEKVEIVFASKESDLYNSSVELRESMTVRLLTPNDGKTTNS